MSPFAAAGLWLVHLISVAWMTGLIWLIQRVHYPLMCEVDPARFASFHAAHSRLITPVVGIPMLLQLGTSALLVLVAPPQVPPSVRIGCLAGSVVVFAATAFLSVPAHAVLAGGFDPDAHARLVATNWVRTLAWTVHLAVVAWTTLRWLVGPAMGDGKVS